MEDEEEDDDEEDGEELLEERSGVSRTYLGKLPRLSKVPKGEVEQGAAIFEKVCCFEAGR